MNKEVVKNTDLNNLLKPYENKWVALSSDRNKVIASGDNLKETFSKVDEKIRDTVAFSKILPFDVTLAPTA